MCRYRVGDGQVSCCYTSGCNLNIGTAQGSFQSQSIPFRPEAFQKQSLRKVSQIEEEYFGNLSLWFIFRLRLLAWIMEQYLWISFGWFGSLIWRSLYSPCIDIKYLHHPSVFDYLLFIESKDKGTDSSWQSRLPCVHYQPARSGQSCRAVSTPSWLRLSLTQKTLQLLSPGNRAQPLAGRSGVRYAGAGRGRDGGMRLCGLQWQCLHYTHPRSHPNGRVAGS